MTELARAFDLLARGDMAGTIARPTAYGTIVLSPEVALRHDSNHLRVDALPRDVSAGLLAEDAVEAHAAAGLGHTSIFVRDEPTGERLAPGFEAVGWEVSRFVVMAHRRPPAKQVDTSIVSEVGEADLRPARTAQISTFSWASPELARELLDAKLRIPFETRFFAVLVDGEPVSWADLYRDGEVAQVEDLATVERHRGRGHASAVVLRAVEEARSGGARLVFLVASAEDWPQELYGRLGFDEIGRYLKFLLISGRQDETRPAGPAD